jgi:outer membrane protein OmpA-like peptidoglycan-associated protein
VKPRAWIPRVWAGIAILWLVQASSSIAKEAFLSFPLDVTCEGRPCTPFTAKISAVQDHSIPTGYNCNKRGTCDGVVRAYNGEEGRKNAGENCPPPGYKNASGTSFLANVLNYVGARCPPQGSEAFRFPERFLSYDGHAGYDFPYRQADILTPADGTLFQAETDADREQPQEPMRPKPQPQRIPLEGEVTPRESPAVVNLPDILFAFGRADLTAGAQAKVQAMAGVLNGPARGRRVSVEGHADSRECDDQRPSLARAEAVARALTAHGVSASRIKTRGDGRRFPVAPNATPSGADNPAGRAKNRRVGVVIES